MATQVTLPRLGQGMESGTIVRWLKAEGDTVDRDEPLYELDTDLRPTKTGGEYLDPDAAAEAIARVAAQGRK